MISLEQVKQKLELALPGSQVQVSDFSQGHEEHNPTGDHIQVDITYSGWGDKGLLEKHRIIYDILEEEMKGAIHALKINLK